MKYPLSRIKEVYFNGYLEKDSIFLNRNDKPNPVKHPKATEEAKRYVKFNIISKITPKVKPVSSIFNPWIVLNKIIATASLIIPSPKSTAFRTGYF